jgi:hypothetical protein
VFVSDWYDRGECHTYKPHESTGRIYKIAYGNPPAVKTDLARRSDDELVALQVHRNDWFVTHARRLLQERSTARPDPKVHEALLRILQENPDATRKLRALWALHGTGGADLVPLLDHESEHVRAWAVRLLADERQPLPEKIASDASPLVRLFVASALQKTEPAARWPFVEKLAQRSEDAEDPLLPLMLWYATEPLVKTDLARASKLAGETKIPLLRTSIARRIASGN